MTVRFATSHRHDSMSASFPMKDGLGSRRIDHNLGSGLHDLPKAIYRPMCWSRFDATTNHRGSAARGVPPFGSLFRIRAQCFVGDLRLRLGA